MHVINLNIEGRSNMDSVPHPLCGVYWEESISASKVLQPVMHIIVAKLNPMSPKRRLLAGHQVSFSPSNRRTIACECHGF